jgi:hypothetical protein
MAKFNCEYERGEDLELLEFKLVVEANDHNDAYTQFLDKIGLHRKRVFVQKGFLDGGQFFDAHISIPTEEETKFINAAIAKEIAEAKAEAKRFHSLLSEALKEIETKSYFELEVEDRIICSGYFNSLIATFEKRGLLPIEIKFIKGWQKLKDRELGESLLAKNEMAKPKAQQGKSRLGNMLMAGMAMSTNRLSHDIGEVSDQVENISEGFGFEE